MSLINTSKYESRAREENLRKEIEGFVDAWGRLVQEKGYPMQFKYKESPYRNQLTTVNIFQQEGKADPAITKDGSNVSKSEVCDSLFKYASKTPNGLEKLKDELAEPSKLNGVLEDLTKLVNKENCNINMNVNGHSVSFRPTDKESVKDKVETLFDRIKKMSGNKIMGIIVDYPYSKYKEIKGDMKRAAEQVK